MGRKVIVTCALAGSATRKNQNPSTLGHEPATPDEARAIMGTTRR